MPRTHALGDTGLKIARIAVPLVAAFALIAAALRPPVPGRASASKAPRLEMGQQQAYAAAFVEFRQNVRAGQQVFVSDEPHNEHFSGVVQGQPASIVALEPSGEVSVRLERPAGESNNLLTVSRARIYPFSADDARALTDAVRARRNMR